MTQTYLQASLKKVKSWQAQTLFRSKEGSSTHLTQGLCRVELASLVSLSLLIPLSTRVQREVQVQRVDHAEKQDVANSFGSTNR